MPEAGLAMSRSPILRQPDDLRIGDHADHRVAAVAARRRSGRIAPTCSSMNSRFATMMSPWRTSLRAASSAAGFSAHSAAAWIETSGPGNRAPAVGHPRAGPAAWLSSVTITTR
jgi:hypothetical protein